MNILNKMDRRRFIHMSTAAALTSAVTPLKSKAADAATTGGKGQSIYMDKLGLHPVINGVGTVTNLGGSIMPPEVIEAMVEASKHFVPFTELQVRVGNRIAELLGVPAAMVSCGAASGITVATAACVVGGDISKLSQLPDTNGLRNEVVQQKSHRSGYEAQMELVGAKIVWVESRKELDAAINDRTAMMFFLNKADPDGKIQREEWIRVGKERNVPTFNDAAADVPPKERLWNYVKEGFDLVVFSGGKGLLGPQGTGLVLGRQDLVEAAQYAISPHGGIGRGMKVGKEEMMGILAAVERYLKVDHQAERKKLEDRAAFVIKTLKGLKGLSAEQYVPEIHNHVPHVVLSWNEQDLRLTSEDVLKKLRAGDPPIVVSKTAEGEIRISMWMLRGDEHRTIALRLKEIFST